MFFFDPVMISMTILLYSVIMIKNRRTSICNNAIYPERIESIIPLTCLPNTCHLA